MKVKIILAGLVFALSSSFTYAENLASVIEQAKAENKKAAELGFEWRDTGKFIKQAGKEKDADKAMTLAKKALAQALAAQKQAVPSKTAGPNF